MLFPALGTMAATWLIMVPLFGLETGFRADLSIAAGILALPLALWSGWSSRAGVAVTVLGLILCLVNFTVAAPIGSLANFATCCTALAISGMAPRPQSTFSVAQVSEVPTVPTVVAPPVDVRAPRSLAA